MGLRRKPDGDVFPPAWRRGRAPIRELEARHDEQGEEAAELVTEGQRDGLGKTRVPARKAEPPHREAPERAERMQLRPRDAQRQGGLHEGRDERQHGGVVNPHPDTVVPERRLGEGIVLDAWLAGVADAANWPVGASRATLSEGWGLRGAVTSSMSGVRLRRSGNTKEGGAVTRSREGPAAAATHEVTWMPFCMAVRGSFGDSRAGAQGRGSRTL